MYSYEDRMKAVQLYIKYDRSAADTIRELGYPSRGVLVRWYREYEKHGDLRRGYERRTQYTLEEKKAAVNYYLEHGRSLRRTIRAMGYPTINGLVKWIDELAPGQRKARMASGNMLQFSEGKNGDSVTSLCTPNSPAETIADEHVARRCRVHRLKRRLLGKESGATMQYESNSALPDDKEKLTEELEYLNKKVHALQLEIDILSKAAEELKKGLGIGPNKMTNREKTIVIDALRTKYSLNMLLTATGISKSSYFYQRKALSKPDKYCELRQQVKKVFSDNRSVYGYRRIHASLRNSGTRCSEKVIRRIMSEECLAVRGKTKRKYSSYFGEISPAVPNLLERDFHADRPNQKWITDLCEFQIPAGRVYLSPMIDWVDGMAVSWTIGISPNAELVNTMLDGAVSCLRLDDRPLEHTDRGCHYRWPGWITRMDTAGLIRSMLRKGCSPDNAACKGFFGLVKTEMFYTRSWAGVTVEEIQELDAYKMVLGARSPLSYRESLGLVA